jgi:hypothetical protein
MNLRSSRGIQVRWDRGSRELDGVDVLFLLSKKSSLKISSIKFTHTTPKKESQAKNFGLLTTSTGTFLPLSQLREPVS